MSRRRAPKGLQPRAVAPGSTSTALPARRSHAWLGRAVVRGLAMVIVFLSIGFTYITSQEKPANAIDVECAVTSEFVNRGPETPGSGAETMFAPGPRSADGLTEYSAEKGINWGDPDSYTLYEAYGVRGALWSETEWYQQDDFSEVNGNEDEKRCTLSGEIMTLIAQMVFDLDRSITSATIALRQAATDATPFIDIIRSMQDEIGIMSTKVWAAGIGIAVMCTGFWVMSKWGGRNQREIVQGLIWVVCSIIGVGFLLAPSNAAGHSGDPNYLWVAESANETTSQFIEDLADALLPQSEDEGPCYLKDGVDVENRGTRILDCSIYETLVFDPWTQGQYGGLGYNREIKSEDLPNGKTDKDLPDGIDIREAQIAAQAVSYNEAYGGADWSRGDDDGDNFDPDTKYGQWNLIRATMWEHHNSDYKYWKGEEGSARISAGFSGLIASILVGIFVCATSLLTMIWNAVPVVLLIALPIVGTFSIFPPLQKFLRGWAQTWLKATILGLVFAVAQMLSLVAVGGVLESDQALGWKCLLMIVLVMALWKVIQAAREDAFTPNLGGEAAMYDADTWGRDAIRHSRGAASKARRAARSKTGRVATGAVVGGTVGGVVGAKRGVSRRLDAAKKSTDDKLKARQKAYKEEHGHEMSAEDVKNARRKIAMGESSKALGKGIVAAPGHGMAGAGRGALRGGATGARRRHGSGVVSGYKGGVEGGQRASDRDNSPMGGRVGGGGGGSARVGSNDKVKVDTRDLARAIEEAAARGTAKGIERPRRR